MIQEVVNTSDIEHDKKILQIHSLLLVQYSLLRTDLAYFIILYLH